MTRTIEEGIEAVCSEYATVIAVSLRSELKLHFCEPWLDKPDGPGWWWRQMTEDDESECVRIDDIPSVGLVCESGQSVHWFESAKWQRAIGPQ